MSKICGECINFDRSLNKCNKMQDDSIRATDTVLCCPFYELKPPTLFDRITQSPETLAPNFVVEVITEYLTAKFVVGYRSTIIHGKTWETEAEAIAATIEKLKEGAK